MPQGNRTQSWEEYQKLIKGYKKGQTGDKSLEQLARVWLGGPVGWYEAISGKDVLHDITGYSPFAGTQLNEAMTEDVYNAMTPEEWERFAHLDAAEQIDFIQKKQLELTRIKNNPVRLAQEKAMAEQEAKRKARELQQDEIIKKVTEFADLMNMPVDKLMQQPDVARMLNQGLETSMRSAMSTGAGMGGLSYANAQQAYSNALAGLHAQRQAAGQQALGNVYGMLSNQLATAEDIARYNQGLNLQFQEAEAMRRQQEYMQGLGVAQGRAGMIGGVIGGIWGGPSGAAMGQQIGSGLGGMRYQNQNPYKPYQFTYPSGTRPQSGGMSSRQYGGNY